MNARERNAPLSITERVYEEGGQLLIWSPGSQPTELVPLGNGRFADREEPGITFDFAADSAASVAMGATNSRDRDTAETQRTQADIAHDGNEEIGWLTVRMRDQPGFVLTGSRITGL